MGESIVDIGTTADCDGYLQKEATFNLRLLAELQSVR
jgi:hypothetical protein